MTDNFCGVAMQVLKDQILQRTQAFNVQQLLDFTCVTIGVLLYQRRCFDIANNRPNHVKHSSYLLHGSVNPDTICVVKYEKYVSPF